MLDICSVCLRTGIEHQALEETLHIFYNALCGIEFDGNYLYCPTCVHLLRKFYNFRNKCHKAYHVMKKWKNESIITRIPINELYTKLSPTSLGMSNYDNRAIYRFNNSEENTESNSNLNDLNSYSGNNIKFVKQTYKKSKENDKYEIALQNQSVNDSLILFGLPTVPKESKTEEQDLDDDSNNVDDVIDNNDIDYHDEINMYEVSNVRKSDMELSKDEPEKKKRKSFPNLRLDIDLEETKRNVKKKLKNGDVIDKDGNVIKVDVIVNNLHKLHKSMYTKVQTSCAGDEPLTPEAIEFLSRIQKRYGTLYSSVFITKHLTTDKEIMEVFREKETNQNYVQSEHKCTQCFKYFKSSKLLDYHIDRFHDPSNPHKCRYCDATFSRRTLLYHHTQAHRVVYQCKLCPLVTNYMSVVDSHSNMHTGAKYRCTKCTSVFKTRPPLAAHMNSMHAENFVCPYCARKFHSNTGLRQHKQQKHRDVINTVEPPSVKCELCDIQFISDEVYLEHLRKSHNGPPKARGPCKKRTPRPNPKSRKPRYYTCRMCKHVEASMGALIWHFKSAHPGEAFDLSRIALRKPHKHLCHLCGKGFADMTSFKDHKNVHTGARPYTCTECPKAFFSRNHLRNHLEFHAPPTHQCTHCGKKFHSKSNLSAHLRMHAGNRRYACKLCGKTFLHQGSVNAHIRGVHQHIRRRPTKRHTKQAAIIQDDCSL